MLVTLEPSTKSDVVSKSNTKEEHPENTFSPSMMKFPYNSRNEEHPSKELFFNSIGFSLLLVQTTLLKLEHS